MGHKVLIGGTAYEVSGGRCLVDGTGYDIKKGRTLVEGTGYDIVFSSPCTVTITTSGSYASDFQTVTIDGVIYSGGASVSVEAGTTMVCKFVPKTTSGVSASFNFSVTVNGETVFSSTGGGSYSYQIEKSVTVTMYRTYTVYGTPTNVIARNEIITKIVEE